MIDWGKDDGSAPGWRPGDTARGTSFKTAGGIVCEIQDGNLVFLKPDGRITKPWPATLYVRVP